MDTRSSRPPWWWTWPFSVLAILLIVGSIVFSIYLIAQAIASNAN